MNNTNVPQGWECPKCKRVYAPSMMMCSYCPENIKPFTTTGTSTTYMHSFSSDTPSPTAKTKCNLCGKEKWEHHEITYT